MSELTAILLSGPVVSTAWGGIRVGRGSHPRALSSVETMQNRGGNS